MREIHVYVAESEEEAEDEEPANELLDVGDDVG